jgi:DNA repair protein RadC
MATKKAKASDSRAQYKLTANDDDTILGAAEAILRKRLERLGAITDPTQASSFLRMRLAGLEHEEFHAIFLDTKHRILACEMLFRGTVDAAEIHPREVAKRALSLNAAAVIVAHNHPSGTPEPSAADRAVTARLKQALATIDVRMLDHIVVGAEGTTSLAARGWV